MNIRYGNTMGMAFRFCDQGIDRQNIRSYLFGYWKFFNNMLNLMHTAMMMVSTVGMLVFMSMLMFVLVRMTMSMGVYVLRFFLTVNPYRDVRTLDPAFGRYLTGNRDTGDSKTIQLGKEFFFVREKLQQSRCQHIARCAHPAVQI